MRRLATIGSYESFVVTTVVDETAVPVDEDADLITIAPSSNVTTNETESETGVHSVSHDEVSAINRHVETELTSADTVTLIKEQTEDSTLQKYFEMAHNGNK